MPQYERVAAAQRTPVFGVRWSEFDLYGHVVVKGMEFKSAAIRDAFCRRLETRDNFNVFLAFCTG